MNCFMSYNPNVAKEVKITTWIKEFDGASPVYPSFPNEGDVFIVFDNDEAKEPSVNKTYTSGEWADTSSGGGGGGGGDFSTATVTVTGEGGELYVPNILTTDDTSFAYPLYDSDVLTVILYKGKCMILSHDTKMSSTDETFELLYPNGTVAMITGDCTITLSAS